MRSQRQWDEQVTLADNQRICPAATKPIMKGGTVQLIGYGSFPAGRAPLTGSASVSAPATEHGRR
jgi:hypothetical protein